MTVWRGVDQLNMPDTAADEITYIDAESGCYLGYDAIEEFEAAVSERVHWESGYAAGLYNARYGSQVLNQLRQNEDTIAELRERVERLTDERDGLKHERTTVRKWLGEFYCPLYPDTDNGRDLVDGLAFYSDQGVHLAMIEVKRSREEVARLTAQLDEARAWAKAWKAKAKERRRDFQDAVLSNRIMWRQFEQTVEINNRLAAELDEARAVCVALLYAHRPETLAAARKLAMAAVYQAQTAGNGDTAATDDPYHAFGQWAAANGYDLDTQDGRDRAVAAYGEQETAGVTAGSEVE